MTAELVGLCGIYPARLDAWSSGSVHYARCSVCQDTFTHYRKDGARALWLGHLRPAEGER